MCLPGGLGSICLEGQQILGYVPTIIFCSLEFYPDRYCSFLSIPCGKLGCRLRRSVDPNILTEQICSDHLSVLVIIRLVICIVGPGS